MTSLTPGQILEGRLKDYQRQVGLPVLAVK
jgi:hypothetical protein